MDTTLIYLKGIWKLIMARVLWWIHLNHCITLLLLRPKAELLVKQHFCFQTERYRLFLKMTIYKHFQSAFAKQRKTYAIPVENICSGIRVLDQINLS